MRVAALTLALCVLALGAFAQDRAQTLADIRQELTELHVELQRLRMELSTTGSPALGSGQGAMLDRLNAIESQLTRVTNKTEQLELRINRIVADGTNRIGDLEFRLVELEGGDISTLGETTTLGGPVDAAPVAAPLQPADDGPQLAANERADFDRASEALAAADYAAAVDGFAAFAETYPGSPLAAEAELGRGSALEGLGDTRDAARAYLSAFRVDQSGPLAAEALFRLGRALGGLGQINEACVTLGEVAARFPASDLVPLADQERTGLECP